MLVSRSVLLVVNIMLLSRLLAVGAFQGKGRVGTGASLLAVSASPSCGRSSLLGHCHILACGGGRLAPGSNHSGAECAECLFLFITDHDKELCVLDCNKSIELVNWLANRNMDLNVLTSKMNSTWNIAFNPCRLTKTLKIHHGKQLDTAIIYLRRRRTNVDLNQNDHSRKASSRPGSSEGMPKARYQGESGSGELVGYSGKAIKERMLRYDRTANLFIPVRDSGSGTIEGEERIKNRFTRIF
ncbi:hypothetical protein Cni_G19488 [Canna indica]|uniref:Uncharacterized protein n=1 Tax=Canna indica TaxID=4628 RepID=A0AAQ3KM91_9LILI|nr:hypothetical protein Cni_G19488 [Canna indica]